MRATIPAPAIDTAPIATGEWIIDPANSVAEFTMRYALFATLKGRLGAVEGTLILNARNPARSAVTASIAVESLHTGNRLRDRHLRSGDFFEAKRFPTITFQSTSVEAVDSERYRVVGALTIRDVTRKVELDAHFDGDPHVDGALSARFTATTTLSRHAFGLGRGAPGGAASAIASDHVTVTLHITATAT